MRPRCATATVNESENRPCPTDSEPLHLAVALDGTGWHPASWREPDARPDDLLSPRYWTDLVTEAERGLLDFVTIEDGLTLQSDDQFHVDDRTDRVRGRLDAVLIAVPGRAAAPGTSASCRRPSSRTPSRSTCRRPSPRSTTSARAGRAFGCRWRRAARPPATSAAGHPELSGPRSPTGARRAVAELLDEAADYVEVLRRLWDSWEDDAEIRDVATGRFVDRNKLHYIDFEGAHVLRQGSVDHAATTAGPADRRRARSRRAGRTRSSRAAPTSAS